MNRPRLLINQLLPPARRVGVRALESEARGGTVVVHGQGGRRALHFFGSVASLLFS
jgi:hypothetical protein